eukprot:SAG31_NODE_21473_length_548_cov_14.534521_1_plen_40_part_10
MLLRERIRPLYATARENQTTICYCARESDHYMLLRERIGP